MNENSLFIDTKIVAVANARAARRLGLSGIGTDGLFSLGEACTPCTRGTIVVREARSFENHMVGKSLSQRALVSAQYVGEILFLCGFDKDGDDFALSEIVVIKAVIDYSCMVYDFERVTPRPVRPQSGETPFDAIARVLRAVNEDLQDPFVVDHTHTSSYLWATFVEGLDEATFDRIAKLALALCADPKAEYKSHKAFACGWRYGYTVDVGRLPALLPKTLLHLTELFRVCGVRAYMTSPNDALSFMTVVPTRQSYYKVEPHDYVVMAQPALSSALECMTAFENLRAILVAKDLLSRSEIAAWLEGFEAVLQTRFTP